MALELFASASINFTESQKVSTSASIFDPCRLWSALVLERNNVSQI